ncbi:hypothetical protein BZA77DRAFT_387080 [Pyronema omphalodes]|nr:hypothetical protein BZA77DRAFT_387080 [Pyronema omphalodes]
MPGDIPDTPRLPSAFPTTPQPKREPAPARPSFGIPSRRTSFNERKPTLFAPDRKPTITTKPAPTIPSVTVQPAEPTLEPWIPLSVLDAPTQRLYAFAIFGALQAYKFYDLTRLNADDGDITTLWFYMKWWILDSGFFWYLPTFKIPWLCFTPTVSLYCIFGFVTGNALLPYISGAPLATLLTGIWKLFYDREVSISERKVKWGDIIHNDTHIMGKYTVHILPEGIARINPDGKCYCIGPSTPTVNIPIKINGTQPIKVQLSRVDLETGLVDVIDLSPKEIKKLVAKAPREDTPGLKFLPYAVKQPGLYRLLAVKDISELDVRIHRGHALVATCPKAVIETKPGAKKDVCTNDMSNINVRLEGLPPFSLSYARIVRGKTSSINIGRLHPEQYDSPLLSGFNIDDYVWEKRFENFTTWTKRETVVVPVNDSLSLTGEWLYEMDSVTDGCGNVVDYKAYSEEGESWIPKFGGLGHKLVVHGRPQVHFEGCDPQHPLALPRGRQAALPLRLDSQGADAPFKLQLDFTPSDQLTSSTEHSGSPIVKELTLKSPSDYQWIKEPGLYSIRGTSSSHCSGDVLEPASCLVITPPEPSLSMEHDEILDKCTKSSIGLNLDFTLVGTPPFSLTYRETKDNNAPVIKTMRIDRARHQVRFTPEEHGTYTYEFYNLGDKNYNSVKLDPATHRIVQTVKPIAGAHFINPTAQTKTACIDQPVNFEVKMQGTAPLTLHYDLIHGGRRTRITDKNITDMFHTIRTPPLSNGGDYSLALTSVEDQSGCKVFLESEVKIKVRFQRPKAQFSPVEGKMNIRTLEGKPVKIPLRLTGEGPWFAKIRNVDKEQTATEHKFDNANSVLMANKVGTYVIESVRDNACPGSVLPAPHDRFSISTIERPQVRLPPSAHVTKRDEIFTRKEVCEGDEDSVELNFIGSPPFVVNYERLFTPESPKKSQEKSVDSLTAGLAQASVRLETSKAGLYEYRFNRLSDSLYDDPKDKNMPSPIVLRQTVNPRPSTAFLNPSKVYKYCLDSAPQDDTSIIPIQLIGTPPFSITVQIKHHSTGKKDVIHVPNIETNHHDFKIPQHALTLGDHSVSIQKVKDARGCSRRIDDGPFVTVAVADMPTIAPAEQRVDYCVGERIAFSLAGLPPFAVEYKWNGETMMATNQPSNFVRVAERPGEFIITGLQDSASDCKVAVDIRRTIHEVPSVRISEGTSVVKGIPEGDQAEINFRFYGTPPFTFTYTRSALAKKGQKPRILESHSRTADDFTYSMWASQEGTYEVTSIEDKYCSYPASGRKANSH